MPKFELNKKTVAGDFAARATQITEDAAKYSAGNPVEVVATKIGGDGVIFVTKMKIGSTIVKPYEGAESVTAGQLEEGLLSGIFGIRNTEGEKFRADVEGVEIGKIFQDIQDGKLEVRFDVLNK